LVALRDIATFTKDERFNCSISKGFNFYRTNFFERGGLAKYYHDRTYPVDIHSIAQSIITLVECRDLQQGSLLLAQDVFNWAWNEMRHPTGYYFFQSGPVMKKRIPYMRWSQAWMLLALSVLSEAIGSTCSIEDLSNSKRNLDPVLPLTTH